jgi:hypothetical protein
MARHQGMNSRRQPFQLLINGSRRHRVPLAHARTKTGKAPQLNEAAPNAFVASNEADAARLDVLNGDRARIVSRRAANNLMPQTWDRVSKQPVQKIAAVRLEPIETTTARSPLGLSLLCDGCDTDWGVRVGRVVRGETVTHAPDASGTMIPTGRGGRQVNPLFTPASDSMKDQ